MWTAKITEKSTVDSSGRINILFDVYDERDKLVYPSQTVTCFPLEAVDNITVIVTDLKKKNIEAKTINIGDEITV